MEMDSPANYETDYFFWPATSYYTSASQGTKGILFAPGEHCYMWTSTAAPITSPLYGRPGAYYLDFQTGDHLSHVQVGPRDFGFPNDPSILDNLYLQSQDKLFYTSVI